MVGFFFKICAVSHHPPNFTSLWGFGFGTALLVSRFTNKRPRDHSLFRNTLFFSILPEFIANNKHMSSVPPVFSRALLELYRISDFVKPSSKFRFFVGFFEHYYMSYLKGQLLPFKVNSFENYPHLKYISPNQILSNGDRVIELFEYVRDPQDFSHVIHIMDSLFLMDYFGHSFLKWIGIHHQSALNSSFLLDLEVTSSLDSIKILAKNLKTLAALLQVKNQSHVFELFFSLFSFRDSYNSVCDQFKCFENLEFFRDLFKSQLNNGSLIISLEDFSSRGGQFFTLLLEKHTFNCLCIPFKELESPYFDKQLCQEISFMPGIIDVDQLFPFTLGLFEKYEWSLSCFKLLSGSRSNRSSTRSSSSSISHNLPDLPENIETDYSSDSSLESFFLRDNCTYEVSNRDKKKKALLKRFLLDLTNYLKDNKFLLDESRCENRYLLKDCFLVFVKDKNKMSRYFQPFYEESLDLDFLADQLVSLYEKFKEKLEGKTFASMSDLEALSYFNRNFKLLFKNIKYKDIIDYLQQALR